MLILILLALPQPSLAGPRDSLTRLILVPQAPGGDLDSAPIYSIGAVPEASFELFIDPELGQQDIEEYLADRAWLLTARYAVWLYCLSDTALADTSSPPPPPTLVIEPDAAGTFPLSNAAMQPGALYAWQVVATLDGSSSTVVLWSAPLYFRIAPVDWLLPDLLPADVQQLLLELLTLSDQQLRSSTGEAASLRGLKPYSNYPSASDTYICSPVIRGSGCPLSSDGLVSELPLKQISALGASMSQALALQQKLRNGEDVLAEVTRLGSTIDTLQLGLRDTGRVGQRELATLQAVAQQLNPSSERLGRETALAGLSQFIVAADQIVGYGMLNLNQDYQQSFLVFAGQTSSTLRIVNERQQLLIQYLGQDEAAAWVQYFEHQRAELALLTDEVQRGRLAKDQLARRIAAAAGDATPAAGELDFLEGTSCRVKTDRTRRLTAADTPQLAMLTSELLRCYLLRLSATVWPQTP